MYHHADHLGMMVFFVYSRCQAFLRLTRSFDRGGRIRTNDLQGAEIDTGGIQNARAATSSPCYLSKEKQLREQCL